MIITRIISLSITIVLIVLIRKNFKERVSKEENKIKQPSMYLLGGLVSCIIFTAILVSIPYLPTEEEYDLGSLILFNTLSIALAFGGLTLIIYYLNWGVILREDTFIYSDFLGRKHEFTYKDCLSHVKSARVDIYSSESKRKLFSVSLLTLSWDKIADKVLPYLNKYQE